MAKSAKPSMSMPLKSDIPKPDSNQINRPVNNNPSVRITKLPFVISFSVGFILLIIAIMTNNSVIGLISVAILIVTLIIFYEKTKGRKKRMVRVSMPLQRPPNRTMSRIDRLLMKNDELKRMNENVEKGMKKN